MRQVTKKGLISVAAASGVLAMGGGYAHADSAADGNASNSPGVLSGNSIQAPVNIPVNVCGNTVNVIGLLNPAIGNSCSNSSSGHGHHGKDHGGAYGDDDSKSGVHHHGGGATAEGNTSGSPGVISGNNVQLPVDVPVNACGDSVTIVGLGNAAGHNDCENESTPPVVVDHQPPAPHHHTPRTPSTPVVTPHAPAAPTPVTTEQLAETGAGGLGLIIPASAGLLLGGAILYRRSRAAA